MPWKVQDQQIWTWRPTCVGYLGKTYHNTHEACGRMINGALIIGHMLGKNVNVITITHI